MGFQYKVTGPYNDWCELYMNKKMIHQGLVFVFKDDEIENSQLHINFGEKRYVTLNLRKSNHFILAIPLNAIIENSSYIPLVFTEDEFLKLMKINLRDAELINISKATNEDLIKLWYSTSKQKVLSNYDLRNIIAYSNCDEEIDKIFVSIKRNPVLKVIKFDCKYEDIITYLEINNKIYEWDAFVKYDTRICLKLTDQYGILLNECEE